MAFIDTRKLAEREPKPGWHGRFFDSEGMSFAVYRIEAGASLHEHSHPNEEVWNVISGELEITIGGESHRAGPGCAALVPPNTAHSIRVLTESSVIVVDRPLRGEVGGTGRAAFAIRFTSAVDVARAPGDVRIAFPLEIRNVGRSQGTLRRL
ncbi:MAG: cupin domain-containing protein, partial [bacterium]